MKHLLSIVVIFAAVGSIPASNRPKFYQPKVKDFLVQYNADKRNQQVESWPDYWDWVDKFYNGNNTLFVHWPGWTPIGKKLIANIRTDTEAKTLIEKWNSLGKQISADWAKDNNIRKIDTGLVEDWQDQLQKATDSDTGDGRSLEAFLNSMQKEVNLKLKKS